MFNAKQMRKEQLGLPYVFFALRVILSGAQPWNVELSVHRRQTHSFVEKGKKGKSLFNYILVLTVRALGMG